jgi:hypothetical protein
MSRRRPSDQPSLQCVEPREDGPRCTKGAVRGQTKCFIHGLTPEERRELARKGGNAKKAYGRPRKRCPHCGRPLNVKRR